eukprot:CAMPEP_0113944626 /NCGR_PEP_ID=MMETSP1339-20121228/35012_1 /TAXON_ID=94617 /ORGANISM="Fibrocapsa japonica" /LENGTH=361 /DNA_ID=CAMNT_0000949901 /DNA_START=89 /DNA_END=1174 /DNA_ORIENTATION=+ /assembly_acc=CAM_ASM_000762
MQACSLNLLKSLLIGLICFDVCHAFSTVGFAQQNVIHTQANKINKKLSHSSSALSSSDSDNAFDVDSDEALAMATTLAKALPLLRPYQGRTVVIKYGGHAMVDPSLAKGFARDVVLLQQCGIKPVIVHGGGPQIAAMLKRLNIESTFIEGLRVTDAATIEVAEMVLSGSINKAIVSGICAAGGRAVGISGRDDNLIEAEPAKLSVEDSETGEMKVVDLGFVGEPTKVNAKILEDLVAADVVPVVAPLGSHVKQGGDPLNINADTSAGAVAGALGAARLLLLTDVAGVMDTEKNILPELTFQQIEDLKQSGAVTGGMIPKLATATQAVEAGADASVILDGRVPHAVLLPFLGGAGGTVVKRA